MIMLATKGPPRPDRTMARLSEAAYWIGMGKDVNTENNKYFRFKEKNPSLLVEN